MRVATSPMEPTESRLREANAHPSLLDADHCCWKGPYRCGCSGLQNREELLDMNHFWATWLEKKQNGLTKHYWWSNDQLGVFQHFGRVHPSLVLPIVAWCRLCHAPWDRNLCHWQWEDLGISTALLQQRGSGPRGEHWSKGDCSLCII